MAGVIVPCPACAARNRVDPARLPAAVCGKCQGRLADVRRIVLEGLRAATTPDMAGRRVLVNLGPTREPWDAVRFWTNPSTGTMGAAVAVAAWLRGAEVTAVCGPVGLWLPEPITRVDVTTAAQMHAACLDLWPAMDAACLTAAVADFRPEPPADGPARKFKKAGREAGFSLNFLPNADILKDLGARKGPGQRLMGFAAETDDLEANARRKLDAKNLDLVCANRIGAVEGGFGAASNVVTVLTREGRVESWPQLPKTEVAWRLWDMLWDTASSS